MTKSIKRELLYIAAIITVVAICLILTTGNVNATTNAPGGDVKNAAELNTALGGGHTVSGHTVTLSDDVQLGNTSINIKDAETSLTIDMNGHSLTATGAKKLISVSSSVVHITGNGTFTGAEAGKEVAIELGYLGNLTIDSGTFNAKSAVFVKANNRQKYIYLTINGGDLGEHSVSGGYGGILYLAMNGGKLGEVDLSSELFDDGDGEPVTGETHQIHINGGTVKKIESSQEYCTNTIDLYMKGGCVEKRAFAWHAIIKAGKIKGTFDVGTAKMYGGEISGTVAAGNMKMDNGKIVGRVNAFVFNITGGSIVSNQSYALHVGKKVTMNGGIIKTTKSGAKGVVIRNDNGAYSWSPTFYFNGGNIISSGKNGSAGIYLAGKDKYPTAKVYFQHKAKKTNSYIKGFKYGMYRKTLKNTKASLKTHTRLVSKKTRKASYYAGQKLPRILKGDIKLMYTKVKSK